MKTSLPGSSSSRRRATAALFAAAVMAVASLASVGGAEPKPRAAAKESGSTKEIVLPVDGMSCVACVARVKKELSGMRGVAAVNVDLAARNARITFDPHRVSPQLIAAAINKLGYKAGEPKDAPRAERK